MGFIALSLFLVLIGACGGNNAPHSENSVLTNQDLSDETTFISDIQGSGQITLKWVPPTRYVTGAEISTGELGSYDIYWGNNTDELTYLTSITDPLTQELTLYNLEQGEYLFSIVAKTIYGSESDQSNVIRKIIN